jgi:ATP-dependent Clp protease adapter protein ClpS
METLETIEITKTNIITEQTTDTSKQYNLILWNDDVNDFSWILNALMEICLLNHEEAYEIMMQAHEKGKTVAKSGELNELETMQKALNDREINATIESF